MKVKKFIIATLAAFVVMFLLGGLWHVTLLGDFYTAQTEVLLGVLILAFLMALVYPIGYKGGSPVREGLRFGVLIGLIWILPWSVIIHGIWKYPLLCVIVDSVWHIVEQGIGGLIIGIIYGKGSEVESK
jgi:hypothetical protein